MIVIRAMSANSISMPSRVLRCENHCKFFNYINIYQLLICFKMHCILGGFAPKWLLFCIQACIHHLFQFNSFHLIQSIDLKNCAQIRRNFIAYLRNKKPAMCGLFVLSLAVLKPPTRPSYLSALTILYGHSNVFWPVIYPTNQQ